MPKWAGEAAVASAFSALNEGADESDAGGSDSPEINKVVEMCLSHSAEYKMVVFDVEKIMKALSSHSNRMKVMYVIDGICRKARGKSKDQFQSRFAGRMKQISALLDGCEGSVRTNFVRLISAWRQQDIIPASSLPHIDPTIEKNVLDNNRSSKDNNEADQPQKENKQKKTGNGKAVGRPFRSHTRMKSTRKLTSFIQLASDFNVAKETLVQIGGN